MKALVGVDGSSNSLGAVSFIGQLLSPEHDELILFFATPVMSIDDERLDLSVEERVRSMLTHNILDAALERLPAEWRPRAQRKDMIGLPGSALIEAAQAEGADLIVVGYQGTSSILETFLLGSVSRKVIHSATVPVLVVKPEKTDSGANKPVSKPLHLLTAYDGEHAADSIASVLSKFNWPAGTEGQVISVVKPMFLSDLPDWVKNKPRDPDVAAMADAWKEEHSQNLVAAKQELERFRDLLPTCFAGKEPVVAEGRPGDQIIAAARNSNADLIVLGISARRRLERLLIGGTTEQVLASGACSVLIVR